MTIGRQNDVWLGPFDLVVLFQDQNNTLSTFNLDLVLIPISILKSQNLVKSILITYISYQKCQEFFYSFTFSPKCLVLSICFRTRILQSEPVWLRSKIVPLKLVKEVSITLWCPQKCHLYPVCQRQSFKVHAYSLGQSVDKFEFENGSV